LVNLGKITTTNSFPARNIWWYSCSDQQGLFRQD